MECAAIRRMRYCTEAQFAIYVLMLVWLPMPRIGRIRRRAGRDRGIGARGCRVPGIQEIGDGGIVVDGSCCNGQEY